MPNQTKEISLTDNPYLLDYWFKFTIYKRPNTQDKGYITNLVYTYLGKVNDTFIVDNSSDLSAEEYGLSEKEQKSVEYFLKTGGKKVYLNQRNLQEDEEFISNPYKVKTQNGWEDFWLAGFTHLSAIEQDKYPKTTSETMIDPIGGVFGFYTKEDNPLELRPRMFSMIGNSSECNGIYFLADALKFGDFSLMQFKINSATSPISNPNNIPSLIEKKNCFYFVWANQNTSGMASVGGKAFTYYYLEESILFDLRQDLAVWQSTGERVYDNADLMAIAQIVDKRLQVYVNNNQMVSFNSTIVPLVQNQDPLDIDMFLANNVDIQFELPRPIFRVNFNVNIDG